MANIKTTKNNKLEIKDAMITTYASDINQSLFERIDS